MACIRGPAAGPEDEEEDWDGECDEEEDSAAEVAAPSAGASRGRKEELDEEQRADIDQGLLQTACLPVSGAPLPPGEGFPQDADEYLRQVQWERLHCPDVVDAGDEILNRPQKQSRHTGGRKGPAFSLFARGEEPELPLEAAASKEWSDDAAKAFRALRLACHAERAELQAAQGTKRFTLREWRTRCARDRPESGVLALQDFVSLNNLIVEVTEAFLAAKGATSSTDEPERGEAVPEPAVPDWEADAEEEEEDEAEEEAKEPALPSSSSSLERSSEWAFAALAYLEEPIVDDAQFQLQRLRRACLTMLREDERQAVRERANLLLVIVTHVFGQR